VKGRAEKWANGAAELSKPLAVQWQNALLELSTGTRRESSKQQDLNAKIRHLKYSLSHARCRKCALSAEAGSRTSFGSLSHGIFELSQVLTSKIRKKLSLATFMGSLTFVLVVHTAKKSLESVATSCMSMCIADDE